MEAQSTDEKPVILINPHPDAPKEDSGYIPTTEDYTKFWHPYGLGLIASHMRERGCEGRIIIADQAIQTRDEIDNTILEHASEGSIIGISPTIASGNEAERLAKLGQEKGARIFYGGLNATLRDNFILKNQSMVEAIIRGDGEEAFWQIANGKDPSQVLGITYRDNDGQVRQNPLGTLPFDSEREKQLATWTDMNYEEFFPLNTLQAYTDNYVKKFGGNPDEHVFTFMSQRGCFYNVQTKGCRTCSRIDNGIRSDHPQDVWRRLREIYNRGGRRILSVESEFAGDKKYFDDLIAAMPPDMKGKLKFDFIFNRAGISDDLAEKLKNIGVQKILLGLESEDQTILRNMRKGSSHKKHLRTLETLERVGIRTILSYIVGSKGESIETLNNTKRGLQKILERFGPDIIDDVTLFHYFPLPGAEFYDELMQKPEMHEKYGSTDKYNPEIERDWVQHFCPGVSWDDLVSWKKETETMVQEYLFRR